MNKPAARRSLLLLSNSWNPGQSFLSHAREMIPLLIFDPRRVLVVDFANPPHSVAAEYTTQVLSSLGHHPFIADRESPLQGQLQMAQAIFVMGGNTFRLLAKLRANNDLGPIRRAVDSGIPYIGSSAGTNVACPTIRTTNDMPVVDPGSLRALSLIRFQINTHYTSKEDGQTSSESRDDRLTEFVEETALPVLALPEGDALLARDNNVDLLGPHGATIFTQGPHRKSLPPGRLSDDARLALKIR